MSVCVGGCGWVDHVCVRACAVAHALTSGACGCIHIICVFDLFCFVFTSESDSEAMVWPSYRYVFCTCTLFVDLVLTPWQLYRVKWMLRYCYWYCNDCIQTYEVYSQLMCYCVHVRQGQTVRAQYTGVLFMRPVIHTVPYIRTCIQCTPDILFE